MAALQLIAQEKQAPPAPLIGRDEMNLAEFPMSLLADYAPKGQKTLYFQDSHGQLTITGSDKYGLPTATDADVILALIYLTKLRNDFEDEKVNFSRYEVIKLLNWKDDGRSYKRLDQSLNRCTGVLLIYDKCWWNNRLKRYTSAKMHIIDTVEIFDADPGLNDHLPGQITLPLSYFTWNKKFIESCQADNLRQLDLDEYFSLDSAVAKRLYRFLGKRFYTKPDHTFDLNEIAFDRVGLSRSYKKDAGKIKEKLQPGIEELESIGFLRPLSRDKRYIRIDRGQWEIRLIRGSGSRNKSLQQPKASEPPRSGQQAPLPQLAAPELTPLAAELAKRGVTETTAIALVQQHDAQAIEHQIEILDWLLEKKPAKVSEPGAYLVHAIKTGHAAPKGFKTKAQQQAEKEAACQRDQKIADDRARDDERLARDREKVRQAKAYRNQLDQAGRIALEAEALAAASTEDKETYQCHRLPDNVRDSLMLGYIANYLAARPDLLEQVAVDA
jgi:hypothetical protein